MEKSELLKLTPDKVCKLPLPEQLIYWQDKYNEAWKAIGNINPDGKCQFCGNTLSGEHYCIDYL